jgi:hypothetical protein
MGGTFGVRRIPTLSVGRMVTGTFNRIPVCGETRRCWHMTCGEYRYAGVALLPSVQYLDTPNGSGGSK